MERKCHILIVAIIALEHTEANIQALLFERICNPLALSIRIFNPMIIFCRIKNAYTLYGRIANPAERRVLLQVVDLLLEQLQFVAHVNEAAQHFCLPLCAIAVGVDDLSCGSQLEAAHLHQVVNEPDLFDVLLRVLAHLVRSGSFRFQIGELRLPVAQGALVEAEHLGNLLDGVVELEVLVQIQGHISSLFLLSVF